jgi:hypothetical protein
MSILESVRQIGVVTDHGPRVMLLGALAMCVTADVVRTSCWLGKFRGPMGEDPTVAAFQRRWIIAEVENSLRAGARADTDRRR